VLSGEEFKLICMFMFCSKASWIRICKSHLSDGKEDKEEEAQRGR